MELLAEGASKWIARRWKAAGITNHDLIRALRRAYEDTLSSIGFGLCERKSLLGGAQAPAALGWDD